VIYRIASTKSLHVYDVVTSVGDRLLEIVNKYYPAPPRSYRMSVPFEYGGITVRFKPPVKLSVLVFYDSSSHPLRDDIEVHIRNCELNYIHIGFWDSRLWKVELFVDPGGEAKTGDDLMLAYLAFPEIRKAVVDADIEFETDESKRWFYEFLDALDVVSMMPDVVSREDLNDLLDWKHYVKTFGVSVTDFSEHVYKLNMYLSLLRDDNRFEEVGSMRLIIEVEVRSKGVARFVLDKSRYTSFENITVDARAIRGASAKDVMNYATETLFELLESDHVFSKVKKALTNFVDAYLKALVAFKFTTV